VFIGPDCLEKFLDVVEDIAETLDQKKDELVLIGYNSHRFDLVYLVPLIFNR
jgi:hypothetical protein